MLNIKGFFELDFLKGRFIIYLFLPLLLCGLSSPSSAFAFQTLEIGKKVPEIQLKDVEGKEFALASVKGKTVVLLFWGMDTPVKEKRSLRVISRLENLYRRLKGEGLEFISVNSDPGSKEKVRALKQQASWSHHTLLDDKREVYGAYGTYIIPTVGILDEEKRLLKAFPFTHTLEEDVEGEILVTMGKKTPEELEKERHPKETLLPENKRKAQSHFNLGKNLLEKGSTGKAKEEFLKAIQLDPDHGDAHVGLGMVYLKEKNPKGALPLLEKGIILNPNSRQGHVGIALVLESVGENLKAIEKLEGLLKEQVDLPEIHYHLGRLYEKEGQKERALLEYKKALQSIFKVE
jgi:tetratricopeptide (TPR) repeat protein